VDAFKRRPWIDWIHTARDQGAIVRNYTKWDDQPASPAAAREALIRAAWIATTAPRGPVYVNLDAEMQEAKLPEPLAPIQAVRFMPSANPMASAELIEDAAAILKAAKHPVMLMGRVSRSLEAWNERVALAEALNAKVISDLKIGCGFPTDHPLHAGAPASNAMVPEAIAAIKAADVILALDWVDLGGALRNAVGQGESDKYQRRLPRP
jgi:thiamine pyrophosphate-dependent acetolactate synthase large subunit-like protein